jgi:hypothetical protein
VKKAQIALSDSAVADILDQADWYEGQSDRKLAMRVNGCRGRDLIQQLETMVARDGVEPATPASSRLE